MNNQNESERSHSHLVTFYHDIEQQTFPGVDKEKCRQAVQAFLEIEKKFHVPASYNVVGRLYREQPDLIGWITENGQEVAFHSYNHYAQEDSRNKDYETEVKQCRTLSDSPKGYRSPRSQYNQNTMKALWENGFLWSAEMSTHKEPFFVYAGLVQLPIAMDDWLLYTGPVQRKKPIAISEWLSRFSNLFETRRYIAIGAHDSVASCEAKVIDAWEQAIRIAIEKKALIASFSQATDLFRRRVLADHYSKTARTWNWSNKTFYRTKRFEEIIRAEAIRMDHPVIADLGSGGGLLSSPLRDIAKEIYCVDNAPGMISQIDPTGVVLPRLAEVTDSGLPESSVDLVICSRIIEYLFDPDYIADEIVRIGKTGGIFVATFPASRDNPGTIGKSNYSTPDQRLRRYFTSDEIKRWADQIGPGHLIGVQYDAQEPSTPEMEEHYRSIDQNPPPGARPRNWVYVGSIQNKEQSGERHQETLPISTFEFRYEEAARLKELIVKVGLKFPRPIRRIGRTLLRIEE